MCAFSYIPIGWFFLSQEPCALLFLYFLEELKLSYWIFVTAEASNITCFWIYAWWQNGILGIPCYVLWGVSGLFTVIYAVDTPIGRIHKLNIWFPCLICPLYFVGYSCYHVRLCEKLGMAYSLKHMDRRFLGCKTEVDALVRSFLTFISSAYEISYINLLASIWTA